MMVAMFPPKLHHGQALVVTPQRFDTVKLALRLAR
jgi:hypothetical protein